MRSFGRKASLRRRGKLREASWTSLLATCHPLAEDGQSLGPRLQGRPAGGRASPRSPGAQRAREQVHAKLQLVDLAGSECAGEPRASASIRGQQGCGRPEQGSRLQRARPAPPSGPRSCHGRVPLRGSAPPAAPSRGCAGHQRRRLVGPRVPSLRAPVPRRDRVAFPVHFLTWPENSLPVLTA